MIKILTKKYFFTLLFTILAIKNNVFAQQSRLTTSKSKTILNKLYPKANKLPVTFTFGSILNTSYIDSLIVGGEIGYYFNETWGIHIEASKVLNTDKNLRTCLENWYYDLNNNVSESCWSGSGDVDAPIRGKTGASFSPVYPNIRELDLMITASVSWNPIYGKQLTFLSFVNRFDLFFKLGAGISMSKLYKKQTTLKNGKFFRKTGTVEIDESGCAKNMGVCQTENWKKYIGEKGRPNPIDESSPTATIAIGQRFHFLNHFNLTFEIRNYTLFADKIDFITVIWGGLGARI